jgi:hypothetical protein
LDRVILLGLIIFQMVQNLIRQLSIKQGTKLFKKFGEHQVNLKELADSLKRGYPMEEALGFKKIGSLKDF